MRTLKEVKKDIASVEAKGKRINDIQNEGYEGYDNTDYDALDKLFEEKRAIQFKAEWSLEQTVQKREAWNAEVRKIADRGWKINCARLEQLRDKLGFSGDELKDAMGVHNLVKGAN